jgi:hypothetical protein
LRDHLDTVERSATSLKIVTLRWPAVKYLNFNSRSAALPVALESPRKREICAEPRCSAWARQDDNAADSQRQRSLVRGDAAHPRDISARNRDLAEIAIIRLAEYKKSSRV